MEGLRTWVEIDQKALEHNLKVFLNLIPKRTALMAVIKSNAYGHSLTLTAKLLANFQFSMTNFQNRLWFGVDSIVEALRLRREGIKNHVLVLGSTLLERVTEAAAENIILTVSNFESLTALAKLRNRPAFHIKIDTGMHRQGFLPGEIFSAKGGSTSSGKLIKLLKIFKLSPAGIYTHFASAKDVAYPTYTLKQFSQFKKVIDLFKRAGFKKLIKHAAASGGTLLFSKTHLDIVRVGMGLYGYWPSLESQITYQESRKRLSLDRNYRGLASIELRPALSWKTIVGEMKEIPAGSFVSYDLTEKVARRTKIAILPVGYWHGYDRGLSSIGQVLIRGKRARVLGRVTMDMIIVDVTDISGTKAGDEAVLIGRQKGEEIWADELAMKIGTNQYEFLTRINPLIKRIIV